MAGWWQAAVFLTYCCIFHAASHTVRGRKAIEVSKASELVSTNKQINKTACAWLLFKARAIAWLKVSQEQREHPWENMGPACECISYLRAPIPSCVTRQQGIRTGKPVGVGPGWQAQQPAPAAAETVRRCDTCHCSQSCAWRSLVQKGCKLYGILNGWHQWKAFTKNRVGQMASSYK